MVKPALMSSRSIVRGRQQCCGNEKFRMGGYGNGRDDFTAPRMRFSEQLLWRLTEIVYLGDGSNLKKDVPHFFCFDSTEARNTDRRIFYASNLLDRILDR